MPIPTPATAELLYGIPYIQGPVENELITPTGAALIATLCDGFGDRPEGFVTETTAYGSGGYDLEIPNVLRMEIGNVDAVSSPRCQDMDERGEDTASTEELLVLEANIDDCSPQVLSYAMDRLFDAGALDVWQTPILMKKGRNGLKLSILCPVFMKNELEMIIFAETTSIGIRSFPVERTALERREETVPTPWGPVRIKISSHNGTVCSATPEYEDCRKLAEGNSIPLKSVIENAQTEWTQK